MSLKDKTLSGLKWTFIGRFGSQGINFLISIVLARLVLPEEFGLVGMVMVIMGFANLVSEFGLTMALIQRRDVTEAHRSSVFWVSIGVGALLTAGFFFAADAISAFYDRPRLVTLTRVIALAFLLKSLEVVPRAVLQRAMDFDRLARAEIASTIVPGVVGITMAALDFKEWALVGQQLTRAAFLAGFIWVQSRWFPRQRFRFSAFRDLLRFSVGQLGFNVVNYWGRNLDELLIGQALGERDLGIYQRAYSLMLMPISQITAVITRVMFPALASIQDDKERVRRIFLRALALIAFAGFPALAGLIAVAEPFILTLYGDTWAGVVPILQILSAASLLQVVCNPVGWLYQSQGRTDWLFYWGLGGAAVFITGVSIGMAIGTTAAVAWGHLIATAVLFVPCFVIPGRLIGMTFGHVVRAIGGTFLCAAAMSGSVWGLDQVLPPGLPQPVRLAILVTVGVVCYVGLAHLTGLAAYRDARALLREQLLRRRAGPKPSEEGT